MPNGSPCTLLLLLYYTHSYTYTYDLCTLLLYTYIHNILSVAEERTCRPRVIRIMRNDPGLFCPGRHTHMLARQIHRARKKITMFIIIIYIIFYTRETFGAGTLYFSALYKHTHSK
jgi:hypothetical protein